MKEGLKTKLISWGILIALALTWGSSFILIKKGLGVYSSQEVGALRIIISFLILLPFALMRIKRVQAREWKYLFIIGAVGSVAPAFLFAKAQTGIDSNLAGILNSLTSLFTLIIGLVFFQLKTRWFNVFGVFLGLIGAVGLISVSGGNNFSGNIGHSVFVIIATICYAINVNVLKKYLKRLDAFTITTISFFLMGIPLIIYLLIFTDFIAQLQTDADAMEGLLYISILAVFGTGLALIAFNYLIKISSVIFSASVTYLIPVVAVIWGIIDGEIFEAYYFAWIALILLGVYLVNLNYQNRFMKRLASCFNTQKNK
ncbi:MAG: EamA family transporter [Bacteroidales bacterium]|nr:EamA family transporter [Bacteroidales bacterium]MCF8387000.1 EamA family transporter [Bacteroidales bacterium]MCF8397827.1 EamA family transporter [Bacteroidales bacterium]